MENLNSVVEESDSSLERLTTGYELADLFQGKYVRVYLGTGIVLTGTLITRTGKYILVNGKFKGQRALINLDNVSSLT